VDDRSFRISRRSLLRQAVGAAALTSGVIDLTRLDSPPIFQNPLFAGDYADPSILRVGSDFYITHTSYHYSPGLVIWHSQDLVNWSHLSNGLNRTFGEVWAPDLIEHQGQYVVYFPLDGQLYAIHSRHPRGPWSEPVDLKTRGIDPGHVVGPEGKRYLHFAGGKMVALSPDGLSVVGEEVQVYDGWTYPSDWQTAGFWLESPKLIRRGQYYYLICAEGGTDGPPTSHMAVAARSASPTGPWENSPYNPLIHTYSADETWWSVGHGTLVSTPANDWYIVYHGYRREFQTLGRHTLMEPIEWTTDGWPRAPLGPNRDQVFRAPLGISERPMIDLSDSFLASELNPTWGAWDETSMSRFKTGLGSLSISAKGPAPAHSSPLTIMARHPRYQVQVVAEPTGGCGGALGLFYNVDNWLFAELKNAQLKVYGPKEVLATCSWRKPVVHLRIVNRNNRVAFLASEAGSDWHTLVQDIDVSGYVHNRLKGFQCLRLALASSVQGETRFADFAYKAL